MATKFPEQVAWIKGVMERAGISSVKELANASGITQSTMIKLAGGHQKLTDQKRKSLEMVEKIRKFHSPDDSNLETNRAKTDVSTELLAGLDDADLIAGAEKLLKELKAATGEARYRKTLSLAAFTATLATRELIKRESEINSAKGPVPSRIDRLAEGYSLDKEKASK